MKSYHMKGLTLYVIIIYFNPFCMLKKGYPKYIIAVPVGAGWDVMFFMKVVIET